MPLKPTRELMREIEKGEVEGLRAAAELVGQRSDEMTPEDTGALIRSRRTHIEGTTAAISYGEGLDDPRAVLMHEDMTDHHDHGGAKYLERALAASLPEIRRAIASEIAKRVGFK